MLKTLLSSFIFSGIIVAFSCGHIQENQALTSANPNTKNISLAQWSLHKALWNKEIDHLDFARIARDSFDIGYLEYVSQFFQDKAENISYLDQMLDSCRKHDAHSVLIMVDGEGELGDTSETKRVAAVQNHIKWLKAAKHLGCYAIRVNGNGHGNHDIVKSQLIKSLIQLSDSATNDSLFVLVENHGIVMPSGQWNSKAFSTDAKRLAEVLKSVNKWNVGALPDFGNFDNNVYQSLGLLMPYTIGISAKTFEFNEDGEETTFEFARLFDTIHKYDFKGFVGIEYEGTIDEYEGIRRTKKLIEKYSSSI